MVTILQLTNKVITKYANYKFNLGNIGTANSTTAEDKAVPNNSKYTVSLGAAIFFAFLLNTGILVKSEPRHAMLFYYKPLQLTLGAVFFPMSIILWNPKLKKKFLEFFQRPAICLPRNRIATIS